MAQGLSLLDRSVARWSSMAARLPRLTLLLLIGLLVASAFGAATGLSVNTDTRRMLADDLDFQIWTRSLDAKFPMLEGGIIVVVRGGVEEDVDLAVQSLAGGLKNYPGYLSDVFAPSADPFLLTHGLLFKSRDEIEKILKTQATSATLIDNLAENQTLDALFGALTAALQQSRSGLVAVSDLDPLMSELVAVISSVLNDNPQALSWLRVAGQTNDEAADDEPQTVNTAVGAEAPALFQKLIFVEPILDFTALEPAEAALNAINDATASLDPTIASRVDIGVTGEPALRTEELASVANGIEISFAISLVLVAILLLACFLSLFRGVLALVSLLIALTLTAGLASVFVGELNLVSIAFTVLLVGLGLDFAIHFLAQLEDGGGHGTVAEAVAEAGHSIGAPLVMSAITTALAFLSFVPTNFVGMGQLGLIGALGVIMAFFVAVTFLPALLALNPRKVLVARRPAQMAETLSAQPNKLQFILAILFCGVAATLTPLALEARFDTDPMELRDPNSPAMQAVEWLLETPDTSPYRISAVASSADTAAAIKKRLSGNPEVYDATWLGDFVADDQDAKLDLMSRARSLPTQAEIIQYGPRPIAIPRPRPSDLVPVSEDDLVEEQNTVANDPTSQLIAALRTADLTQASGQLQAVLERYRTDRNAEIQSSLQESVFRYLDNLVRLRELQSNVAPYTAADLPPALIRQFLSEDGTYRIDIAPAGDMTNIDDLKRFVAAVDTPGVITAGGATEVLRSGETVSQAMQTASLLALCLVFTVSLIMLRSITMTFAIVIPLLVGALLTAALSVQLDLPFNYANVIVLPLLIGLGVDSGIHLALRGDRLRTGEAVFNTSTPKAIVFSALTTIAAFGALSLNDHRGTASMGMMLTLALSCTIAAVLILTPPLVHIANTFRGKNAV